ncbi:hypothetical protein EMIT0232MI5_250001 [Pseudomonas sp. IT-232MI5]
MRVAKFTFTIEPFVGIYGSEVATPSSRGPSRQNFAQPASLSQDTVWPYGNQEAST